MDFKISRTKSLARPPEDFEPLYGVKPEEILDFTERTPGFSLTIPHSEAQTPEMLMAEGRLLLGIEKEMRRCPTAITSGREQERRLGKFLERGDSVRYVSTKDGRATERLLANFVIVPTEWCRHLSLHGEHLFLSGYVKTAGRSFAFEMPMGEITRLLADLRVKHPTLRLDAECRNSEALFKEYVATTLEVAGELPERLVYEYAGWGHDFLYHHGYRGIRSYESERRNRNCQSR